MTIQLDETSASLLRGIAAAENRTEAEVVQALVAEYAKQAKSGVMAKPRIKGVGKYGSGTHDTSARAEEILGEAAKDGLWP